MISVYITTSVAATSSPPSSLTKQKKIQQAKFPSSPPTNYPIAIPPSHQETNDFLLNKQIFHRSSSSNKIMLDLVALSWGHASGRYRRIREKGGRGRREEPTRSVMNTLAEMEAMSSDGELGFKVGKFGWKMDLRKEDGKSTMGLREEEIGLGLKEEEAVKGGADDEHLGRGRRGGDGRR